MYIVDNQEKTLLICFFLRVAEEEFSIRSQNLKFFDKGSFRILKYGKAASKLIGRHIQHLVYGIGQSCV